MEKEFNLSKKIRWVNKTYIMDQDYQNICPYKTERVIEVKYIKKFIKLLEEGKNLEELIGENLI